VTAKYSLRYHSCTWETIEAVGECFPYFDTVPPFTLQVPLTRSSMQTATSSLSTLAMTVLKVQKVLLVPSTLTVISAQTLTVSLLPLVMLVPMDHTITATHSLV